MPDAPPTLTPTLSLGRRGSAVDVESLTLLLAGFATALQPVNLLFALAGCLLGTLIGILPGIGPVAGSALVHDERWLRHRTGS